MMRQNSLTSLVGLVVLACATDDAAGPPKPGDESTDAPDASVGESQHDTRSTEDAVDSGAAVSDAGVVLPSADAGTSPIPEPTGVTCADLVCDEFASCVGADEPRCVCAPGLEGDGQRCVDIDECQELEACGANADCQNTFGGHACSCRAGYTLKGEQCVAEQDCDDSPCADTATCAEPEGKVVCTCDEDNFGNGFFCAFEDACADEPCGENGQCISVAGDERPYVCACDLGFEGAQECSPCGDELVFEDQGLARAVREQLGLSPDDTAPILVQSLEGLTTLDASRADVKDLSGLECWSNLKTLDLSYNAELTTEGAQELATLNQLTVLRLDCTLVTDLRLVSGHPALRLLSANTLNCDEPPLIESATPIGSLAQLEVLDLRGQVLPAPDVLAGLRNLRSLWLGYTELETLSALSELPLLRELDASFNQLDDLDGLEQFPRLQYLNVSNNSLESLLATEQLAALRFLNASDNKVQTLPSWDDAVELREINVSYNQLTTVGTLANLGQVTWLNLAGNEITTLAPLVDGVLRGSVVVSGNPLPCDVEAATIAELRRLGMDVQGECVP